MKQLSFILTSSLLCLAFVILIVWLAGCTAVCDAMVPPIVRGAEYPEYLAARIYARHRVPEPIIVPTTQPQEQQP